MAEALPWTLTDRDCTIAQCDALHSPWHIKRYAQSMIGWVEECRTRPTQTGGHAACFCRQSFAYARRRLGCKSSSLWLSGRQHTLAQPLTGGGWPCCGVQALAGQDVGALQRRSLHPAAAGDLAIPPSGLPKTGWRGFLGSAWLRLAPCTWLGCQRQAGGVWQRWLRLAPCT